LLALIAAGLLAPAAPTPDAAGRLDLDRYQGKVVLVDFWASWCAPCAASFPWMQQMVAKHGEEGLVVIAVNLDEDSAAAERFLGGEYSAFEHVQDPTGVVAEAYGVRTMPTSILFDRQGRAVFVHAGFKPERGPEYEEHLVTLLEGRAAPLAESPGPISGRRGLRPWRHGILAQPEMRLDCDPLLLATDDHIYFSKEASSGGRGFGGGGCGCN
jgi:thiol-disulfide isomerase/thioredoxin